MYLVIGLTILGLIFIGIGIFLMITKPKKAPAIITIISGVAIIILAFISIFGGKDESEEKTDRTMQHFISRASSFDDLGI